MASANEGAHHISSTLRNEAMPIESTSELSNPIQALQPSSLIESSGRSHSDSVFTSTQAPMRISASAAYPMKSEAAEVAATNVHAIISGGIIPPQLPDLSSQWDYNEYVPLDPSGFGCGDVHAHMFGPLHQAPDIYPRFQIAETRTPLYARKATRIPLYLRKGISLDINKNANPPESNKLLHQQKSPNEIDNLANWNPSIEKHRGNVAALSNETSRDVRNRVNNWEVRLNLSPIVHMPPRPPDVKLAMIGDSIDAVSNEAFRKGAYSLIIMQLRSGRLTNIHANDECERCYALRKVGLFCPQGAEPLCPIETSELIQQAVTKMRESSMNIGMFALGMEREVEDDWYEAIPKHVRSII
uniref:Uncharacterized protein n=1 Tax=Ascaris lumbricoides TaxID=6252 RepID=A0A9J2PJW3_ASCLU